MCAGAPPIGEDSEDEEEEEKEDEESIFMLQFKFICLRKFRSPASANLVMCVGAPPIGEDPEDEEEEEEGEKEDEEGGVSLQEEDMRVDRPIAVQRERRAKKERERFSFSGKKPRKPIKKKTREETQQKKRTRRVSACDSSSQKRTKRISACITSLDHEDRFG